MTVPVLDAAEALAEEDALLTRVSRDPSTWFLRFWSTSQCLVVPRKIATDPAFPEAAKEMASRGWPVHVRGTGGDVTPQGPGIVNVTHVYARAPRQAIDMNGEYAKLCAPIEAALGDGASRGWQPGAFCDGAHNVQWNGKKFAGTAMRFRPCKPDRSRQAVLAHALMLFEPPSEATIEALNTFLTRLGQARRISLDAHTGIPPGTTEAEFLERLTEAFEKQHDT